MAGHLGDRSQHMPLPRAVLSCARPRRLRRLHKRCDRVVKGKRLCRVGPVTPERDGLRFGFARAEGNLDRHLLQGMFTHLVANLLVAQVGFDAQPGLAQRLGHVDRPLVGRPRYGRDHGLHGGEPQRQVA